MSYVASFINAISIFSESVKNELSEILELQKIHNEASAQRLKDLKRLETDRCKRRIIKLHEQMLAAQLDPEDEAKYKTAIIWLKAQKEPNSDDSQRES